MAKVSAHGTCLLTYFSTKRRGLVRYMSDGTILRRTPWQSGWKLYAKGTPEQIGEIVQRKDLWLAEKAPSWVRSIKSIPSLRVLKAWEGDSACETPSGYVVEPDGFGPDGSPSWLILLGLI